MEGKHDGDAEASQKKGYAGNEEGMINWDVQAPADHPLYLLDVKEWKVRKFEDCWKEPQSDLKTIGYGSISYAWGNWNDRKQTAKDSPNYPKGYPGFDIGEEPKGSKLEWVFPIVKRLVNYKHDPSKEQFTIDEVRRALESMDRRFVWWDWACIPQNLGKDHPLARVANDEMDKMRFVYPYSTRTIMWMHNVDWDRASPLKTAVQLCADILSNKMEFKKQLRSQVAVNTVYKIVEALSDVHLAEDWFRSLWCFQEGVLCAHPGRRLQHKSGGIFCDKHGKFLGVDTERQFADVKDLIEVASEVVDLIIDMLQANVEEPPAPDTPQPSGPPSSWSFKDWCSDPAYEQPARGIVNSLMETGLVGMVSHQPLSLLNARLGRHPSKRASDLEIEVMSIIGALDVDVSKYRDDENARVAKEKAEIPKDGVSPRQRKRREEHIDSTLPPVVREGMLAELFRHYQWRMLLLATPRRASDPVGITPDTTGIWSEIVKVPRYRPIVTRDFTALETFMSTGLDKRFKPPRLRYEGDPLHIEVVECEFDPKTQFPLPRLEYRHETKLLVLKHTVPNDCPAPPKQLFQQSTTTRATPGSVKPYKVFNLKTYAQPLWTKCMFYGHTNNNGSFTPTFEHISWADWQTSFGYDVVLLPLEYTHEGDGGEWQKKTRLRCVVLSNFARCQFPLFGGVDQDEHDRAMFVGVVDIEGEDAKAGISLESANRDLDRDVVIF